MSTHNNLNNPRNKSSDKIPNKLIQNKSPISKPSQKTNVINPNTSNNPNLKIHVNHNNNNKMNIIVNKNKNLLNKFECEININENNNNITTNKINSLKNHSNNFNKKNIVRSLPRKSPVPIPKNYQTSKNFLQNKFKKNNNNNNNHIYSKSNINNNNNNNNMNKTSNTFKSLKNNSKKITRSLSPFLRKKNSNNNSKLTPNFNNNNNNKNKHVSKSPNLSKSSLLNKFKNFHLGNNSSINNNFVKKNNFNNNNNSIKKNIIKSINNNNHFKRVNNVNTFNKKHINNQVIISDDLTQNSINNNINNKSASTNNNSINEISDNSSHNINNSNIKSNDNKNISNDNKNISNDNKIINEKHTNENKSISNENKNKHKKIKFLTTFTHVGFDGENDKEHNQDSFFIKNDFAGHKDYKYLSVCDGHGVEGHNVSNFIKNLLPEELSSNLKKYDLINDTSNVHEIIIDTFLLTNEQLVDNESINSIFSGTTCVSVIYTPTKLICPNIGDSRAVLAKINNNNLIAVNLSRDHKPTEKDEANRIYENEGRIQPFIEEGEFIGPERVWVKEDDVPGLAMTRSFGDRVAATVGVISEPEIIEYEFKGDEKFMLIASDGVWEFISSEECMNMIKVFYDKGSFEGCCECIYEESKKRWMKEEEVVDDITMILVVFE